MNRAYIYASTALAMATLLLTVGCGKDWEEEIVLQIWKQQNFTMGVVNITAVQDGKKMSVAVNGGGTFFNSCEDNKVRIIPAQKGGTYSDVSITISSGKLSATQTIKVPTSGTVEVLLGAGPSYDPRSCKPSGGTTPKLKETGESCKTNTDCKGGRCLFVLTDSGKAYKFANGYCTANCMKNTGACGATTCSGAPGAGEKDCCYAVSDGYGKKIDAVCLKRCGHIKDCRLGEGYTCTPGSNCFPK